MLTAVALVVCFAQRQNSLPKLPMQMPVIGGQREIVVGPKPAEFALLNGFLEQDVAPSKLITPDNTGGYVDSWVPGGTHEESLGYFDCVTRQDRLFSKDCVVITTTAKWNQKFGPKTKELNWQNYAKEQYWVGLDGKILRHYLLRLR
jgi:hypothetical protein